MKNINKWIESVINETNNNEKIRLFYELAKYIHNELSNQYEGLDEKMQELTDDILKIVNDIVSL